MDATGNHAGEKRNEDEDGSCIPSGTEDVSSRPEKSSQGSKTKNKKNKKRKKSNKNANSDHPANPDSTPEVGENLTQVVSFTAC